MEEQASYQLPNAERVGPWVKRQGELVFTPENTLIVEDYVQFKSSDGGGQVQVSLVNKAWQKGRTTVVVFPVGNTLKGKRYVQREERCQAERRHHRVQG